MKDKNGIDRTHKGKWQPDPIEAEYYRTNFAKDECVVCHVPIDKKDYDENGNFCPQCCIAATKMAHRRLWERRMEEDGDNPFAYQASSMLASEDA